MGLYKRTGSTVWWCRFTVQGKEVRRSTGTKDRRKAQVEERRLRAQEEADAPDRRPRGHLTLADIAGLDYEERLAEGAGERRLQDIEREWEKLCAFFGADTSPADIGYDEAQNYVLRRREKGVGGQTIVREIRALKRGLTVAHRQGFIRQIPPMPKLRAGAVNEKLRGKLHPPHILAAFLARLPTDARDEATLTILTGLRAAELKRITIQWVEPAPPKEPYPALLKVPAASAKGRKPRVIPLVAEALAILTRRAEALAECDPPAPPDTPLLFQGSHKTAYRNACAKLKYSQTITLRDLRHTWGTLVTRSVGLDAARDGLGHSNLAVTSRYVTGDAARVGQGSAAIAELLGRHSKSAQSAGSEEFGRSWGDRTPDQRIKSPISALLDHVSTCSYCAEKVERHMGMQVIDGEVGTGESAHG